MLENAVLILFAVILAAGIGLHAPLYVPLFLGLILFIIYGLIKKHKLIDLLRTAFTGLKSVGDIMVLFVIIGMLTASWRACGTIASITCFSSYILNPQSLVVVSFILCSAMSFIAGSSFVAAATIGVICMTIACAMGANQALVAGAVISGAFFGDRCSPLSATVNLVSSLTETDVFNNVDRLIRTSVVPYIFTALLYILFGLLNKTTGDTPDFFHLFSSTFNLNWICLLPTIVIIIFSIVKLSVTKTMLASLITSIALCIGLQGYSVTELPRLMIFGYQTQNSAIADMINGGGILSMGSVALIVCIASTYSGVFEETGLLNNLRNRVKKLAKHTTPFTGVLATSLLTTIVACDQILSIMLTKQLCDELEYGGEALALDLCSASTMVSGFIPWSTVCVGLLAFLEAPTSACLFAFFTYLVPLWIQLLSFYTKYHPEFTDSKIAKSMGIRDYDDARRFIDRNSD